MVVLFVFLFRLNKVILVFFFVIKYFVVVLFKLEVLFVIIIILFCKFMNFFLNFYIYVG